MSSVLVFTFVALWHDLSFKLLAWGWLVSLFILPELLARRLLPASKVRLHLILPLVFAAWSARLMRLGACSSRRGRGTGTRARRGRSGTRS